MYKNLKTIRYTIGFICFFSLLTAACDKKEQTESPQQSVVISQKVVNQKIGVPSNDIAVSRKTSEAVTSGAEKKEPEKKNSHLQADMNSQQMAETESEPISEEGLQQEKFYNPAGRLDPFVPLFKEEKAAAPQVVKQGTRKKRIPRTPLEKIDLSQLKLVGILRSESKNRALVEEASGKGYIITVGTYIGTRSGKVVQISADSVIIEEESEDVLGKVSVVKRELKLQKAFGEE